MKPVAFALPRTKENAEAEWLFASRARKLELKYGAALGILRRPDFAAVVLDD